MNGKQLYIRRQILVGNEEKHPIQRIIIAQTSFEDQLDIIAYEAFEVNFTIKEYMITYNVMKSELFVSITSHDELSTCEGNTDINRFIING